jgi:hypothetical protein
MIIKYSTAIHGTFTATVFTVIEMFQEFSRGVMCYVPNETLECSFIHQEEAIGS